MTWTCTAGHMYLYMTWTARHMYLYMTWTCTAGHVYLYMTWPLVAGHMYLYMTWTCTAGHMYLYMTWTCTAGHMYLHMTWTWVAMCLCMTWPWTIILDTNTNEGLDWTHVPIIQQQLKWPAKGILRLTWALGLGTRFIVPAKSCLPLGKLTSPLSFLAVVMVACMAFVSQTVLWGKPCTWICCKDIIVFQTPTLAETAFLA